MLPNNPTSLTEAVYLFDSDAILREMLVPEFDALLDGYVRLDSFAGDRVRAAYALIDNRLQLRALVCFWLDLDTQGVPLAEWNLPLRQLADNAPQRRLVDGQLIALCAPETCESDTVRFHLWNPLPAHLDSLARSIARNRLGILVDKDEPAAEPTSHGESTQALQAHYEALLANLVREQKRVVQALEERHRAALEQVRTEERAVARRWQQTALHLNRTIVSMRSGQGSSAHPEVESTDSVKSVAAPQRERPRELARGANPTDGLPYTGSKRNGSTFG
jgi:hypothetical protein